MPYSKAVLTLCLHCPVLGSGSMKCLGHPVYQVLLSCSDLGEAVKRVKETQDGVPASEESPSRGTMGMVHIQIIGGERHNETESCGEKDANPGKLQEM